MKGRQRKTRLFVLAIASVVCFGAVGGVYANPFPIEPYISITVPDGIEIGSITHPGNHIFTSTFAMHLAANVPHHVEVSPAPFMRDGGAMVIPGSRLEEFRGVVAALMR